LYLWATSAYRCSRCCFSGYRGNGSAGLAQLCEQYRLWKTTPKADYIGTTSLLARHKKKKKKKKRKKQKYHCDSRGAMSLRRTDLQSAA